MVNENGFAVVGTVHHDKKWCKCNVDVGQVCQCKQVDFMPSEIFYTESNTSSRIAGYKSDHEVYRMYLDVILQGLLDGFKVSVSDSSIELVNPQGESSFVTFCLNGKEIDNLKEYLKAIKT